MPPTHILNINLKNVPCVNETTLTIDLQNMTSSTQTDDVEKYDAEGAMEFIVAVLLVYSLMGIVGLLLLRIRKKATNMKYLRHGRTRDEHLQSFIKMSEEIRHKAYKDMQRLETERVAFYIQKLESASPTRGEFRFLATVSDKVQGSKSESSKIGIWSKNSSRQKCQTIEETPMSPEKKDHLNVDSELSTNPKNGTFVQEVEKPLLPKKNTNGLQMKSREPFLSEKNTPCASTDVNSTEPDLSGGSKNDKLSNPLKANPRVTFDPSPVYKKDKKSVEKSKLLLPDKELPGDKSKRDRNATSTLKNINDNKTHSQLTLGGTLSTDV